MECIRLVAAKHVGDHRVWLKFSTGEAGELDLKDIIYRQPAAAPLVEVAAFSRFTLDEWPTLTWDCGFDLDPEYLYERLTGKATYETRGAIAGVGAL